MNKAKNIRNLESLEREIYRLGLETGKMEIEMEKRFEYLQDNFSSILMNSFFRKRSKDKENGQSSFWKSDKVNFIFEKVSDHVADRVAGVVNNLFDRFFHKQK